MIEKLHELKFVVIMERKKAIEVIKKDWPDSSFTMLREALETLIPELKENEDERIRKELITFFQRFPYERIGNAGTKVKEAIDWLEKQCEQKSVDDLTQQEAMDIAVAKCFNEQKPAWTEEDEKFVHGLIRGLTAKRDIHGHTTFSSDNIDITKTIDWLKTLKARVGCEVNCTTTKEWSEEDKVKINRIVACLENLNVADNDILLKDVAWLKSLRPQNRCAYNPYKEVVESIAEMCKHYDKANHSGLRDFYDNVKVKCKDAKEYDSLYPQNTWKPSDEQMNALEYYMHTLVCNEHKEILFGLYSDLKKLKGE